MAESKMASSVENPSDMLYDYMCTSCEESELNKEALYYCDKCTKLYCDDCAKLHNELYKKHKLLGKKDVSKWGALHAGNVIHNDHGERKQGSCSQRKPAGQAYTVEKCQQYSLRIKSDTVDVCISGLCSLPNGNFLAVDRDNSRVKQLNDQFNVISHLDFPSRPYDICHLGDYQVAVIVHSNQIHYLDASNNQLTLTKKVFCDHFCLGIYYHNDQLYMISGKALYIYNRSGKLVKKLYEDKSPIYTVYRVRVARDGQHIYVTNCSKNQLITLDNQGNKLATFSDPDLKTPRGLCTAENGTVFVCGSSSRTVVQVSADGTKKLATVDSSDGVDNPWSILFHEATSQLIVGQWSDNKSLLVMSVN